MMTIKPTIFISYSSGNVTFAQSLAGQLENAGFHVWLDKKRLDVGHDWWDEIEEGITNCAVFLLIMTPQSKESDWVKREILLAEKLGKPIFPVLRSGDLWSRLADMQYEDMTADDPVLSERFIARLKSYHAALSKKEQNPVAKSPSTPPSRSGSEWTLANKIAFASVVVTAIIGILTLIVMLLPQDIPDATPPPDDVVNASLTPESTSVTIVEDVATQTIIDSTPETVDTASPLPPEPETTLILDEFVITGTVNDDLQRMADAQLRYLQQQPFSELETLDWCSTPNGVTLTSEAIARGIASGITAIILLADDETEIATYITDDVLQNTDGYGLASAPLGVREYIVLLVSPPRDEIDGCVTNQ